MRGGQFREGAGHFLFEGPHCLGVLSLGLGSAALQRLDLLAHLLAAPRRSLLSRLFCRPGDFRFQGFGRLSSGGGLARFEIGQRDGVRGGQFREGAGHFLLEAPRREGVEFLHRAHVRLVRPGRVPERSLEGPHALRHCRELPGRRLELVVEVRARRAQRLLPAGAALLRRNQGGLGPATRLLQPLGVGRELL